ncbi:MAG: acetoacetate--CoA ligase [Candidatus Marinimicrobia bacterium]|nr:acetoacetate--CoA ligase [Candidatus Neomarinimicrobiota bacterium]
MNWKKDVLNPMLWQPTQAQIDGSQMSQFRETVNGEYNLNLTNYDELYDWSISNPEDFWESMWKYGNILSSESYTQICDDIRKMPGATWFSGAKLNFAENLLKYRDDKVAIKFYGEDRVYRELTYSQLYIEVEKFASALRKMGVQKGDRVAGFIPNMPEAIIAMLATSSIGAIWSSSSPDFGIKGVLDRFSQIEPKVVIAADGYYFKGKLFDSLEKLSGILTDLPRVEKVVVVKYINKEEISHIPNAVWWDDFSCPTSERLSFEPLPFEHPLYIMYSSGTTGKPKSIVHSAGGTLIQHLKELILHTDLKQDDTIFYFTTCGWMMWNWLVSSLAVGATVVLYDGNPFHPRPATLLKIADEANINIFGTSAKFIASLEVEGIKPSQISNFPHLRAILSTGSPLSDESFDYVYRDWKQDVQLSSISGGTDIVSCFVLGNPTLPVYRGELQCRGLGMKVESFDGAGNSQNGEQGELVCSQAFPSMPVYFWNDKSGEKYHNAYFDVFDEIWCHGDYVLINGHGGVQIFGRSDATLNPGGVRIGTAEIYQIVENIAGVLDSVIVGHSTGDDEEVVLFVKLDDDTQLDDTLKATIKAKVRTGCSPRHVPAKIISAPDIPYTINGKKVEVAVKKLIHGESVANRDALANPELLDYFSTISL